MSEVVEGIGRRSAAVRRRCGPALMRHVVQKIRRSALSKELARPRLPAWRAFCYLDPMIARGRRIRREVTLGLVRGPIILTVPGFSPFAEEVGRPAQMRVRQ